MPNPPPDPARTQPLAPPNLEAPWRLPYLEGLDAKEKVSGVPTSGSGSFMLDYWRAPIDDAKNHVIVRTDHGLILLNAFPYANGHLLVALGDARPRLLDYTPAQRASLMALTALAADLMQRTLDPQGINYGINEGRAAGAGVPQHLHVHLVPRWGGDVNFITFVGQVRIIPSALDAMYQRFKNTWDSMGSASS